VKDLAQDMAEEVLGAAKDASAKAFIVKVLSCPSPSASGGTHATLALRWHMKDEHVRDEPVKDAAQDVAEDVTQDVAEDVLGAAKDASAKAFIVKILSCPSPSASGRTHAKHTRAPTLALW